MVVSNDSSGSYPESVQNRNIFLIVQEAELHPGSRQSWGLDVEVVEKGGVVRSVIFFTLSGLGARIA